MKKITISVVIPSIGRVEQVSRCLSSILVQSTMPDEIIIVDSNRNSDLKSHLERRIGSGKQIIKYVFNSDHSLCKKKNLGVRLSSGNILFFFDDDVVLDKDYIKEVVKVFENDKNGRVGGVTGNISNFGKRTTVNFWNLLTRIFFLGHFGDGAFLPSGCPTFVFGIKKVIETKFLPGGTSAYRKEVFDYCKFDERLGEITGYCFMEDVDFSFRASRKYKLVYTPFATLWHYPSWTRKAEYDSVLIMQHKVLNHFYLFKKNTPRHFTNIVAFCLSILGRLILSLIFERDPMKIFGWMKGVVRSHGYIFSIS